MLRNLKEGATSKIILLACSVALISIAHFMIGTVGHPLHVKHVALQALFVVPVVAAALWFGIRGAFLTVVVVSAVYLFYMRVMWPNDPTENVNQAAILVIFWVTGAATSTLVHLREKERQLHLRAQQLARRASMIQALYTLSDALRLRDEYTRKHSEHVSALAVEIGRRLGLGEERLEILRLSGLVHDIGKIGVRDDILFKPAQLSPEERTSIEQHPLTAAKILRSVEGANEIADVVMAHHECPDGSGYPNHLSRDQIPLEAHIVRVADVFSSLTGKRPYQSRMAIDEVSKIMDSMTPSHLDERSYAVLLELVAEGNPLTLESP